MGDILALVSESNQIYNLSLVKINKINFIPSNLPPEQFKHLNTVRNFNGPFFLFSIFIIS
jgi:penicillin-binding protein-related factor A (putative recombinase)